MQTWTAAGIKELERSGEGGAYKEHKAFYTETDKFNLLYFVVQIKIIRREGIK